MRASALISACAGPRSTPVGASPKPRAEDFVVDKNRYSAFYGTPLDSYLSSLDIRNLVICGVTTNVCVETTARDASQRDYRTVIVRDATGEIAPERHHWALETLGSRFGWVVDSEDVLEVWTHGIVSGMAQPKLDLNMSEIMKMSDEVASDDGPGSASWKGAGTQTERVNDAVIEALRANGGSVPGELSALPLIIITTTGAKSGKRRTVPLAYQKIDGRIVIIASMGGSVRNPPWFHNLVKHPEVTVELDGETYEALAVVTEGADRDDLFRQICENFPTFGEYQQRTQRTIPVVELKRRG